MVAEQKIAEAEYFLDKITQAFTRNDFIPNLSAFLSATRSIPDYLLEDYNTKLGLNIPLTEKLYVDIFSDEAVNQGNQIAQKFIKEYKTQLKNIYNDPLGKLLTTKRNISIHRTGVPIQGRFKRVIHETINISDSVSIKVRENTAISKCVVNQRKAKRNQNYKRMKRYQTRHLHKILIVWNVL